MKLLKKNQMSTVYGGREVERSSNITGQDGGCYNDKIITRNDGSIKVVLKPC